MGGHRFDNGLYCSLAVGEKYIRMYNLITFENNLYGIFEYLYILCITVWRIFFRGVVIVAQIRELFT